MHEKNKEQPIFTGIFTERDFVESVAIQEFIVINCN
jgi:hypothetical protein